MNRSQLLDLVVRLTSTLTDDFTVQDVLDRLAEGLVMVVPEVGAGVVLLDSSNEAPTMHEGPTGRSGRAGSENRPAPHPDPVACDTVDVCVATDDRPDTTVLRFPIRRDAQRLGTLELDVTPRFGTTELDLQSGQLLADVLASLVAIARRREHEAQLADQLAWAALHDPLTGLPNRRLLQDRLEQTSERSRRSAAIYGVLFCDLDGFKPVNDRHGHRVGDQLLIEIGRRLEAAVRPHDTVARVSGDEFIILCEDLADPQVVEDVAKRVLAIFDTPVPSRGKWPAGLGVSIGIAVSRPEREEPPQDMLARADVAMYRAKRRGGHRYELAPLLTADGHDPSRVSRPCFIAAS